MDQFERTWVSGIVAEQAGTRGSADEMLVGLAQRGDADAFDRLAAPRIEVLFRTAVAILGDEDDARDAVQGAFVSAWQQLPRLRDNSRFDAWLGRILVNACRLIGRTRRRRTVHEIPAYVVDPELGGLPAIGLTGPAGRVAERAADLDTLERAFDRLSVDHRAVIVLHHVRGRSLEQVASDLGVPIGTVKSRHHAARQALAAALEAESR